MSSINIVNTDHIIKILAAILTYGINVHTKTKVEELKYLLHLHRFINQRGKLRSYIEETRITVETLWYDPMVSVELENGILSIIPITDDGFYDALSEIMYFITIHDPQFSTKKTKSKKPKKKEKVTENDFEWI